MLVGMIMEKSAEASWSMLVMTTCKWDDREMTWECVPSVSCTRLGCTIVEEVEDGAGNIDVKVDT
jgi:hypothetical protein